MHGILPSEIARLVLDYLETSSCPEAARVFLETSPDLQECRRVAATGGKFITRVFGLTLINILYTFCDIYGLVQERLTKINADERLRRCSDLCEQLRTLIDDCRGQRFFVNINVPAQSTNNINNINNNNNSNPTGGSPIITSSIRKRRHSGPANKEKCNRSLKSQSLPSNDTIDPNYGNDNKIKASLSSSTTAASSGVAMDPPQMTKPAIKFTEPQTCSLSCDETPVQCSSTVGESNNGVQSSSPDHNEKNNQPLTKVDNSCATNNEKLSRKKDNLTPKKLSTGTDTQELMTYSTAEVQTIPYDLMEFESETTDEPIENLSLLTKELLNRTELQERIADNINKAILPTDGLSLKDLSFSECIAANECNTSIMTELNNAIKSIVTATEKDPVFERFFDEIFQADIDGEQSQDDDTRRNIIHSDKSPIDASPRTMDKCPTETENNIIIDSSSNDKNSQLNVPSEIVQANAELVNDPSPKIDAADNQALEDVNAAAVMSIINANNNLSEKIAMETEISDKQLNDPKYNFPVTNTINGINNPPISNVNFKQNNQPISQEKSSEVIPIGNNSSTVIKKFGRKSRVTKPKQKLIPTETVVPTLIVCNKNDINITSTALPVRLFNNIETENNICDGQKSQYVPIAPKNPSGPVPSTTTLYLRTVNVAKKIPTTDTNKQNIDKKINDEIIQSNIIAPIEKKSTTEAITLYGMNENNLTEVFEPTSLPTINIDDAVSFSGSGLSPFLKFNKKPTESTIANEQIINTNPDVNIISRITDCDITKRTPKSLLKSRSMNHRLSLSTPRRRSGHIRALDFSTPPKEINTSRRLSEADACPYQINSINNSKSICRTSLFKTPPFESSPGDKQKNSRSLRSIKTPSADSSPVPKLYGGWDKVSGVGTILGCASPTVSSLISSASSSSIVKNNLTIKKSWDADLRESLEINDDNDIKPREKIRKRNAKINVKGVKSCQLLSKNNSIGSNKSEILNNEMNQNKLSPINEINNSICDIKVLKTNLTTETITVNNKVITKKYAKLKTLATNIKRIDNNEQNNSSNITNSSSEISEKSDELIKINSQQNLSNIAIDLETPRKNENTLGIPPTPRVLSPSSSTPFIQVTEDTGKVRCFITTPEFPPTPCINLTPRQTLENTTDVINNRFSAPYYHPSSELKDNLIAQAKNEQINPKTNKPEITQFEVIKENLPKDEACKELNISINSKDPETSQSMKKNILTDEKENCNDLIKTNKSSEISEMTLSDSSDSDSDTSSSSCSSSCSCNGDTTNNSSRMSTSRHSKVKESKSNDINSSITKLIPKINDKETNDDKSGNSCEKIERQIAQIIPLDNTPCDQQEIVVHDENILQTKNELSPEKVIPINKTQQALDEADTETPAKDEALLCEAEISETPSGSKCGFDTLTNLTSKISAIIGAGKESNSRKYHGVLRKLDTKLSAEGIKTNILASFDNVEGSSRLGKDRLVNEDTIDVANKSKNILEQQNSDKLRGKINKIKTINVPGAESILEQKLKSTVQAKEQTTLRKSRIEMKNIIPKEDKNEKEEKIMENKGELIKNPAIDLVKSVTDSPDKLSSDRVITAVNSPQKNESFTAPDTCNQQISSTTDNKIVTSPTKNTKTELSVLESLKLVPASKIDIVESLEVNSTKLMHNCHREFSFIHDDTVNTKKKNIKKFSPSDLEFTIQLRNDEFVTITATKFEVLFTLPSKSVRSRTTRKSKPEIQSEPKPPMKPTIRSIKTVKGITITKNKKLAQVSTVVSQPLATSSPVQIETAAKISGKIKSTNDNTDDLMIIKGKNVKPDNKKQSMTTRKRKERSESKDDEPAEKKTAVINPKLLLSRVNIDEFLIAVHGPITKS
ncbi:hypothetical protein PV327_009010 [Microctonus hyperodae]|uniref:LisH domain-containing protein n=1 Tax=Microctonus hyperodae TaxID=165561 RepID=A0AA39FTI0_MICHY|nr:hypothetical protein PV327_009010 [Microctonus hyperodae]